MTTETGESKMGTETKTYGNETFDKANWPNVYAALEELGILDDEFFE